MGGAGAADRGLSAGGQGSAPAPAADDQRDHLAPRQRGEMALPARSAGTLVDGSPDLHPLVAAGRVGAPAVAGSGEGHLAGDDLSRRHLDPSPPEGGRGCQKEETAAGRDAREALGRSRGGYGTKACVIADGKGRAIAFRLAPGQAHELPHAVPLLDSLPRVPKWVVGDRGYASHAFRQHIWDLGARPAIPPKRNEAPVACPDYIYSNRNLVERLWARLKEWRASPPATRRPPAPSWACSAWPPPWTGSRANRA